MLSLLLFIGITAIVVFAVTHDSSTPRRYYREEKYDVPPAKERWNKKEYY